MKQVTVDFSKVTGRIKPMHAVNNGPVAKNMESFRDAGFPCCRNHDASFAAQYGGAHGHDVLNIFPNFDADENDPANYDFTLTDKTVRETYECGSTMLYRLGSKIEHEIKQYQTLPPKDYHKYARICEHIIRHYCYGWADGMELPIVYWEIWNEADNYKPDKHNPCWGGTHEEFLEFYEVMAKHLKGCFPELKIGGPAYTGAHHRRHYMETFVRYAAEHQIPLDFFSWHGYRCDPQDYVKDTEFAKDLLLRYGFTETETILNEWNYVRSWSGPEYNYSMHTIRNEKGAAFCAAAMLAVQKTELAAFCYYDARPDCSYNGLFTPYTFRRTKTYYSFWQFNKLYGMEQEVYSDSDCRELFVGAAARDGEACVQMAYYADIGLEPDLVEIDLRGLQGDTEVSCLVIDEDHMNDLLRSEFFTTDHARIYLKLNGYSTIFLTIKPAALED